MHEIKLNKKFYFLFQIILELDFFIFFPFFQNRNDINLEIIKISKQMYYLNCLIKLKSILLIHCVIF